MVTRKEDTARRVARRKYEEKNKEIRKEKNANFQTMIPRELFDEINVFLIENGITKVILLNKPMKKWKRTIKTSKKAVYPDNSVSRFDIFRYLFCSPNNEILIIMSIIIDKWTQTVYNNKLNSVGECHEKENDTFISGYG